MKFVTGKSYQPSEVIPKLSEFNKKDLDIAISNLNSNDLKYVAMVKKEEEGFAIYVYATIANSSVKYQRKTELACVFRNDAKLVSNKLYYTYLAGYRYYFKGMKHGYRNSFTTYDEEQPLCYVALDTNTELNMGIADWIHRDRYLKNQCLNDKKLKHIDFTDIENYWDLKDVWNFLSNVYNHPAECEILIKQGYGIYIINNCIFKGDKRKWIDTLKKLKLYGIPTIDMVLLNFNLKYNKNGSIKNITGSEIRTLYSVMKRVKQNESFAKHLLAYVREQGASLTEYKDFIKIRESLGMTVTEPSAILPRDLNKTLKRLRETKKRVEEAERRRVEAEREKEKKREQEEVEEKLASTIVGLVIKSDTYSVYQPKVTSDFIRIGEEMSNCVGWNCYDKKVAEKKCLIFEIFKDKAPYACLEVDGHGIQQLYLKKNQVCDAETRKFVLKQIVPQTRSYFA